MADMDKELEATLAMARANLAESERMMDSADKARQEFAAWREENGVTDEVTAKFADALSDEDKKKTAAEQEEWNRQLQHDLDAAVASAKPAPAQPRRPRSYA